MTTAPPMRPPTPTQPRPAAAPGSPSGGATIDPLKLVQKYKWVLCGSAVAGAIVGVIGHFLLLWIYPIYVSTAVFECYAQTDNVSSVVGTGTVEDELQRFMATQVQILLSDRLIGEAVNDPALAREAPKWYAQFVRNGSFNPAEAAEELLESLSAGVVVDSSLIQLSFRWTDPNDTTAIVRIIMETYQRNRRASHNLDAGERKRAVSNAIAALNSTIGTRKQQRERILRDENVETLDERYSVANQEIVFLQERIVEGRSTISALNVQLQQLTDEINSPVGITYTDRIRAAVDADPVIIQIKHQLASLEAALLAMQQRGIGPEHRSRKTLEARIQGTKDNMERERERLMRQRFDAEIDQLRSTIAQIRAQEAEHLIKLEEQRAKAADMARTLATVRDIMSEIDHLLQVKTQYEDDLKQLEALGDLPSSVRVVVYQQPQFPREPAFPKIYIMIPIGIVLVVGLVAGLIVLVEAVDQRVKTPADIALIPRTRVLGMVPHASEDPAAPQKVETVFRDQPSGVLAESFRQVRGPLLKRLRESGHKSLLVVAGMPGSGGTSVVVNLAAAMAAAEMRVLVIDANFRRPGVHRALGLPDAPGLAELLTGKGTLADVVRKTDDERVDVLPVGSVQDRRFELLATAACTQLLREASELYDMVLVDVAPAVVSGDALALANRCDASMLVVRALGEKRGQVARIRNELGEARAEFQGVLINGVRAAAGGYLKGNILATHRYQNTDAGSKPGAK